MIEHARFMQIPSVRSVYVCRVVVVVVVVCFYCSRISGEVSDQTFNTLGFSVSKFVKPFSFSSAFNSDLSCS